MREAKRWENDRHKAGHPGKFAWVTNRKVKLGGCSSEEGDEPANQDLGN